MANFEFFDDEVEEIPQENITPSLEQVFKMAMDAAAQDLRVSMPGQITKVYENEDAVDVKPAFKRKYKDGVVQDSPIIYRVPVCHSRAEHSGLWVPLQVGDSVTLVFSDRSIEKWSSNGGAADPEDTRTHDLSDAMAIPGGYPFSEPSPVKKENKQDVVLRSGKKGSEDLLEMRLKKNGKLQIVNKEEELIKVLDDLVTILRESVVYTCNGPQHLRHLNFKRVQERLKTFLHK